MSISIAIDGPAGAGKSTIAKAVSKHLGIIYLDTGAMYRAVGLACLKAGIDPNDKEAVIGCLNGIELEVVYDAGVQKIILNGEDITGFIRTQEVGQAASDVAVIPKVRLKLVDMQREIAKKSSIVMDGRDIGTYVLPNAEYKFFLIASSGERAKRRFLELGDKSDKTVEEIEQEILARDKNDSSRSFAPLMQAQDALLVDTTYMSIQDVLDYVISICGGEK